MSKLAMGRKKATTAPAVVLTRIQKEKLRQRGYLYPATVKALRALRPARGYPVVPGVQRGCGRPLAVDVCALVEQYALQARLFGNSQVECHPDDSEIRQGPMFGVLHRDCQPLRRNSRKVGSRIRINQPQMNTSPTFRPSSPYYILTLTGIDVQ